MEQRKAAFFASYKAELLKRRRMLRFVSFLIQVRPMLTTKQPLVCFECGSTEIDYDPVHDSRYCHSCGTVLRYYAFV